MNKHYINLHSIFASLGTLGESTGWIGLENRKNLFKKDKGLTQAGRILSCYSSFLQLIHTGSKLRPIPLSMSFERVSLKFPFL